MDRLKNDEENVYEDDDEEISESELENNINILQNAINIVKSQRKQTEQETQIIYKRINYLKQKENQLRNHCRNQINQLNKSIEIKKKRLKYEISLEEKKEEGEVEKEKIKEREFKTTTSFNFISENSKGMNLIKNSLSLHDQNILVADRITLFQTMIPTFRKDLKKDLLPKLEEKTDESPKKSNIGFNAEEYFKELDKINVPTNDGESRSR